MPNLLKRIAQGTATLLAAVPVMLADVPSSSAQQVTKMEAPEAHDKALKGEIVLVDIRTPEEWKATGVPASAHAITMHQDPKVFLSSLLNVTGGDQNMPVAVICRTGSRSASLAGPLSRAGFPNVINVAEGVAGGWNGPGWKKRALPMRKWSKDDAGPQLASQ